MEPNPDPLDHATAIMPSIALDGGQHANLSSMGDAMGTGVGPTSALAGDNAALPGSLAPVAGPTASAAATTSHATAEGGGVVSGAGSDSADEVTSDVSMTEMRQILLAKGVHTPTRHYSNRDVRMAFSQYQCSIKPTSLESTLAKAVDPTGGPLVTGVQALGLSAKLPAVTVLADANVGVVLAAGATAGENHGGPVLVVVGGQCGSEVPNLGLSMGPLVTAMHAPAARGGGPGLGASGEMLAATVVAQGAMALIFGPAGATDALAATEALTLEPLATSTHDTQLERARLLAAISASRQTELASMKTATRRASSRLAAALPPAPQGATN